MTETSIDRRLDFAPPAMAIGLLSAVVCRWLGVPGLITAFALMMFGAACLSLERFKTERGLWMLAGFFGLFTLALWGLFVTMTLRDAMRGQSSLGWASVDAGVATVVYAHTWRTLFGVARFNYLKFRGVHHAH